MPKLFTFIKVTGSLFDKFPKNPHYVSIVANTEQEAVRLLGRQSLVFVSQIPLTRLNQSN